MAFGSFQPDRPTTMMSEINVTPMVDVMLVLLVIFILAAPMFTQSLQLNLPQTAAVGHSEPAPASIELSIDAAGQVYWQGTAVDSAALAQRLALSARQQPQPELRLRADRATRYEAVAELMAAAQAQGLSRLGFVTEPKKEVSHGPR